MLVDFKKRFVMKSIVKFEKCLARALARRKLRFDVLEIDFNFLFEDEYSRDREVILGP